MLNKSFRKLALLLFFILFTAGTSFAVVPSITVSVNGSGELTGDISIDYLISDTDSLQVNLLVEFNTGAGFITATVTGTVNDISPAGYSGSIVWNSLIDAGGVDVADAIIRITPSNSNGNGSPGEGASFHLDNNEIPSASLDPPTGESSGDITFSYQLADDEGDVLSLIGEYAVDGVWNPAVTLAGITADNYSGSLIWNSLNDLPGVDNVSILFRITAVDIDTGNTSTTTPFHVDNNNIPTAAVNTPTGESSGDITISYQLADNEGDVLSLIGEYAADGVWNPALTQSGITSDNYSGILIWNSLNDIPGLDANNVMFRITVTDNDTGNTSATTSFHVDNNNPPSISATGPSGVFRGNALINYNLFDDETDVLGLLIEYSLDEGSTWNNASISGDSSGITNYSSSVTWNSLSDIPLFDGAAQLRITPHDNDRGSSAAVSLLIDNIGLPEVNITTSFPVEVVGDIPFNYQIIDNEGDSIFLDIEFMRNGAPSWTPALLIGEINTLFSNKYTGTLIWQSDSAGQLSHEDRFNVAFRMRARDKHLGAWTDTLVLHVDNNDIPEVLVIPTIPNTITGKIDLPLVVNDFEGDSLDIWIQLSRDGGNSWRVGHALGESVDLLPSNYTPTSIWDSVLDIGFILGAHTRLRIAAVDHDRSDYFQSNDFIVDNFVGDFSGDFKIDIDDISGFLDTWITQDTVRETGPADGIPPNLSVRKDGVIDFEDLMTFILMWNWSYESNNVSLSKQISKYAGTSSKHPIAVSEKINKNRTAELYFSIPEMQDVWFGRVMLLYEQTKLNIRDISLATEYNKSRESLFIKRTENSEGTAEIVVAPLDNNSLSDWEGEIIKVSLTSDKYGYSGMLSVAYDLRDKNGIVLSQGLFEQPLEIISSLPKEYSLRNNYPNPFNPATTIEFDLPLSGDVKLSIYNLLGEEIASLIDGNLEAGRHSVVWEGMNKSKRLVSSGVYFYAIDSGKFNAVKKMILIR